LAGRPLIRPSNGSLIAELARRIDRLERRRDVTGHYEIKLFADDQAVTVGDGRFQFGIPINLDHAKLRYVNAYVTTVGSGITTIQIHNVGSAQQPADFDMLSTPLTIDSGEKDSETAAAFWEIKGKEPNDPSYAEYGFPDTDNTVFYRQQLRVDIDTVGSGAMGLGLQLGFE
jgi:hypothetical protein